MKDSLLTKLSQVGIEAIDWTKMTLSQIVAFVEKEAPQVLNQWVQWNFWESLIWFSIGIIFLVSFIIIFIKTLRPYYDKKNNKTYDTKWHYWEYEYREVFALFIIGAIAHLILSISLILSNLTWIKIWIAPRLWVLENIKELF